MVKIPINVAKILNDDELVLQFVRDAVKDARVAERQKIIAALKKVKSFDTREVLYWLENLR